MGVSFGCLKPEEIDTFWPKCREILIPAFRDRINIYTIDDYYSPLKSGALQLWVATQELEVIGAVVSSIDEGSAMRICTVLSLAGKNLKIWAQLFDDALTDFARKNKCKAIEAVTRKGFSRIFPDFEEDGVVYVRILENNYE